VDQMLNCVDWSGGIMAPNTANMTINHRMIRGGIEQVRVVRDRGKGCKHATTSRKRGVDVVALLCCYVCYMHNYKTK
jgi:hypothetical protein